MLWRDFYGTWVGLVDSEGQVDGREEGRPQLWRLMYSIGTKCTAACHHDRKKRKDGERIGHYFLSHLGSISRNDKGDDVINVRASLTSKLMMERKDVTHQLELEIPSHARII